MLRYTVIIEKGRRSGYVAFCPCLKGCVAQGKTKAKTLSNLRIAMKDYVECLIEDGIPVPNEVSSQTVHGAIKTA